MSDKLKPCAHCGNEGVLESSPSRKGYEAVVHCNGCLASVNTITYDTEQKAVEKAIAAWNRRPAPHEYTLEELLKQDRKPVFIIDGTEPENRYWELSVDGYDYLLDRDVDDYNKTWAAYDREPEEESK